MIWNERELAIEEQGVSVRYAISPMLFEAPATVLLMDLDGTTAKSEEYWVYMIELTMRRLRGDERFRFQAEDVPHVSGFTVREHFSYCKNVYGYKQSLEEAEQLYHSIVDRELKELLNGGGAAQAFKPRAGLREFLSDVKARGIKIGLATSGLDYKAIPEIAAVFRQIGMGDPLQFYDAIITGGRRKTAGSYGTLGEMAAKPHPFLYAELCKSLNGESAHTIVLEDSLAGVLAARTAGLTVLGFADGNIIDSGGQALCKKIIDTFDDVKKMIL